MPEILHLKDFQPLLNETFKIAQGPDQWIAAILIEARKLDFNYPSSDRIGRAAFSIVFQAGRDVHLPQKKYLVKHEALGEHQIFLVPIQPDDEGTYYEAVFT